MSEEGLKYHYQQVKDLPVMVCVIEEPGGFFAIGFSMSPRHRYKEDIATKIATVNAEVRLGTLMDRRLAASGQ